MRGRRLRYLSAVMVVIYIVFLPLYSYAGIVQEAEMILNATGKAKVASYAGALGTAYVAARIGLGFTVVGGAITLGVAVYDAYNRYLDYSRATSTTPSRSYTAVTGGDINSGVTGSWGCETDYTPAWKSPGGSCPSYKLSGSMYFNRTSSCDSINWANYSKVGEKFIDNAYPVQYNTYNASCQFVGIESGHTHRFLVYYVQNTSLTATGAYAGAPGNNIGDNELSNTQTMLQAIQDYNEQIAYNTGRMNALIESSLDTNGNPWGSEGTLAYPLSIDPYVSVTDPADYSLDDPNNPPLPVNPPTLPPGDPADDTFPDIAAILRDFWDDMIGDNPGDLENPEYDALYDQAEELSIPDRITSFVGSNPVIQAITGSRLDLSSSTCTFSTAGEVFGQGMSMDWCWMADPLGDLGDVFVIFSGLTAAFIIFKRGD